MPHWNADSWFERISRTLHSYDEPLLREVAGNLCRPPSKWPLEDLVERCTDVFRNAAILDRRLNALDQPVRQLLACLARSRMPFWRLGSVLEIAAGLGLACDARAIISLFETGLVFPDIGNDLIEPTGQETSAHIGTRLKSLESWLGQAAGRASRLFIPPQVFERLKTVELRLPELAGETLQEVSIHEADGLEWPLRLAAIWQLCRLAPFRLTQQRGFFKRDHDRFRTESLIGPTDMPGCVEWLDGGFLTVSLALAEKVLEPSDNELAAGRLPGCWDQGQLASLESLWIALLSVDSWNPLEGWVGLRAMPGPFPSVYFLSLLLLLGLPEDDWADPEDIQNWMTRHHPFWQVQSGKQPPVPNWAGPVLLGLAFSLRLVQSARNAAGKWKVRLSPMGRWLLGTNVRPPAAPQAAQTLLVQPNHEVVVYRQALTPGLIGRLSRFGVWKSLGSACTLLLKADSVYRGLESGLHLEDILGTLENHGMRTTPQSVVDSLRTWAGKRERITVYPSATLFEFSTAEDAQEALARGLPGVRINPVLVAVPRGEEIDYRHFRLIGPRDYGLPPERCVDVEADGVTFSVDPARSDLLLELEIPWFAEAISGRNSGGRKQFRLTPASVAGCRERGWSAQDLDAWFLVRSGSPLSAAGKLLFQGPDIGAMELRSELILQVLDPETADGLMEWPETGTLISGRLGPRTLSVLEENATALADKIQTLGASVNWGQPPLPGMSVSGLSEKKPRQNP